MAIIIFYINNSGDQRSVTRQPRGNRHLLSTLYLASLFCQRNLSTPAGSGKSINNGITWWRRACNCLYGNITWQPYLSTINSHRYRGGICERATMVASRRQTSRGRAWREHLLSSPIALLSPSCLSTPWTILMT